MAPKGMPRPTGDEGHVLLDAVWAYLSEHHRWPTFDEVDRKLYAQGLQFEEVVQQLCPALLLGLAPDLSPLPQGSQELSLTVAGAANCINSSMALGLFLSMVRTAARMEPTWRPADPGVQPRLTRGSQTLLQGHDPKYLPGMKAEYFAAALAVREPCFRGGSINAELLDWSLSFDRTIRPYAAVRQMDEYWGVREKELGPTRVAVDRRPFLKRPTEPPPFPGASPVFPGARHPVVSPPSPMSVTCVLHPLIEEVAAERFEKGFYRDAVRSAFQAIEHRVQTLAGTGEVGERLMGIAFGAKPDPPKLTVTRSTGGSLESEQNGMQFLFKGATGALRNPRMHGPDDKDDRDEAEEMLVFASFLMRRLDIEDDKRKAAAAP
ncbi:TIGR02391 family protein (plasmid) [Streptomyces sp. NBC_01717]|uniref:TIGR02391 family protein n=1 Tax=Streptomyces sp. NBC_01717 TaxID=2975918 RepID=UPI002E359783|nr:TIGR02391 family protein [Streptomyces sp. NBC_01717]